MQIRCLKEPAQTFGAMKEGPLCFRSHIGRAHLAFIVFEPALELLTPPVRHASYRRQEKCRKCRPCLGQMRARVAVGGMGTAQQWVSKAIKAVLLQYISCYWNS